MASRGDRSAEYKKRIRTPAYYTWCNMITRCYNEKHDAFKHYGGRGIKVCDEWRGAQGFKNFLRDMGERPEGLTLDRKEVDGNYCKENCTWADLSTQNKNRRPWKKKAAEPSPEEVSEREKLCEELGINI